MEYKLSKKLHSAEKKQKGSFGLKNAFYFCKIEIF